MEFNEFQKRLWANMLKLMESYRKGELCYSDFVYGLEVIIQMRKQNIEYNYRLLNPNPLNNSYK